MGSASSHQVQTWLTVTTKEGSPKQDQRCPAHTHWESGEISVSQNGGGKGDIMTVFAR